MGRDPNTVKKEHWKGLSLIEKIRLTIYGNRFFDESADHAEPPKDSDHYERQEFFKSRKRDIKLANFYRAASLLNKLFGAANLGCNSFETLQWPGVSNQEQYDKIKSIETKEAWRKFSEAFMQAVKSQDATIFKDMAHILENQYKPIQLDRYIFGSVILHCQTHKSPLPTPTQFLHELKKHGFKFDHKKIARLEDYFEVKLPRKTRKTK